MRSIKVRVAVVVTVAVCVVVGFTTGASALAAHHGRAPNLGPNVIVLSPSMPQARYRPSSTRSRRSRSEPVRLQRYAILFEPGTYGSARTPDFQVGYYTQVAGLGAEPGDVVINGAIDVFNQCSDGHVRGLDNFWRSLSNLTLNVDLPSSPPNYAPAPPNRPGCDNRRRSGRCPRPRQCAG